MERDMTATTRRRALCLMSAPFAAAAAAPGPAEIAFGADPRQKLDLYARPGLTGAPMLLFVHGGGWTFGDKRAVNALPDFARRHGLLFASTNYRMSPQVRAGGSAEDVAAAAAWLVENGPRSGGDQKRLFLMGHSAGAHLVALVGVDPRYLQGRRRSPSDLAGVIAVDGAGYDARAQEEEWASRPLLGRMYRDAFGPEAAALSPTLLVREGQAYPPFLLFYTDRPAAQKRAEELAGRLRGAGGVAAVVEAPGKSHLSINRDMGRSGDPEGERAARFIETGKP
jgi:acetyl esterase/lipase